jgi:heme-degrading monooxygenase HmoA
MPYLLVRHTVRDYAQWKPAYNEHESTRRAYGSKHARLFRNVDNPNETFLLFEWDDLEQAHWFSQSDDLHQTLERAGVADQPDVYFLEEIEQTPG